MDSQDRASRPGVTDPAGSIVPNISGNRFRARRFRLFRRLVTENFAGRDKIRVADIGGTRDYWQAMAPQWSDLPLEITMININTAAIDDPPFFIRQGDACDLSAYADNSFDIVHSNSVIEHVGPWAYVEAMAREVRRLAPHYYLQTPALGFPYEPHYRTLFFHWYPEAVRAAILLKKRRGWIDKQDTMEKAMLEVQAINLLSAKQMAALFPDGRIEREKVLGLTKSHIAIR